jgi:hypothetical protein
LYVAFYVGPILPKKLRRNRNRDSCEKSTTGAEKTGIRRIPTGITNLAADYVGVSIKKLKEGIIELSQRALINNIIADVALEDSKVKAVPAKVSKILHAHLDKPPFSLNFGYQSLMGKLNYLAQTMRPDIVYMSHQLAKYSTYPREPHGEAVFYLICYLKKTCDLGTRFKPD